MKSTRLTKEQRVGISEQILEDEFGLCIEGLTNKQLLQMAQMLEFIGENREE